MQSSVSLSSVLKRTPYQMAIPKKTTVDRGLLQTCLPLALFLMVARSGGAVLNRSPLLLLLLVVAASLTRAEQKNAVMTSSSRGLDFNHRTETGFLRINAGDNDRGYLTQHNGIHSEGLYELNTEGTYSLQAGFRVSPDGHGVKMEVGMYDNNVLQDGIAWMDGTIKAVRRSELVSGSPIIEGFVERYSTTAETFNPYSIPTLPSLDHLMRIPKQTRRVDGNKKEGFFSKEGIMIFGKETWDDGTVFEGIYNTNGNRVYGKLTRTDG